MSRKFNQIDQYYISSHKQRQELNGDKYLYVTPLPTPPPPPSCYCLGLTFKELYKWLTIRHDLRVYVTQKEPPLHNLKLPLLIISLVKTFKTSVRIKMLLGSWDQNVRCCYLAHVVFHFIVF